MRCPLVIVGRAAVLILPATNGTTSNVILLKREEE
jgi:hypothetical protein